MLYELHKVRREIEKAVSANQAGAEADEVLQKGNRAFQVALSEAACQLEEWGHQLDARHKLQRLLRNALPDDEYVRAMWWQEQSLFYDRLFGQVEAYFKSDGTGYLTTPLTALELLVLVRLSIDEGIVKADSLQNVFKSLSTSIGTEKQGLLSADSLKKRYSHRNEGARKKVKQLLMNMIKRMDQWAPDD